MGANVTRIDPRTGKQRTYYKADDGKLYPNYAAAVAARSGGQQRFAGQGVLAGLAGQAQGFLRGAANRAIGGYREADRRLGGWLPGGGTASPVTRAVLPPQKYPERSKELERITGVRARIVDPEQGGTLVRRVAPAIAPKWGENDYANPLLGEIGISGYQGGKTPEERRVEFHELGHLSPADKGMYSSLGVLGRYAQGVSDRIGNPPPLDMAAGLAMQSFDAKEEDRAERYTKRFERIGQYQGPRIQKDGTSDYGNSLRREGRDLVNRSINRLTDPYGLVSGAGRAINSFRAQPVRDELLQVESEMKRLLPLEGDNLSPRIIELSKRHSTLEDRLRSLAPD